MSITAESTAQDDLWRKRYSPPDLYHRTEILLDELVELRVEVQRLQAKQPDDAHARNCRSKDLEMLVLLALDNATLNAAVMAVHQCFRITMVINHLRYHLDRYQITKPPCRKKVKEILIKHGYYF